MNRQEILRDKHYKLQDLMKLRMKIKYCLIKYLI
jgi:hypothetical protein